MRNKTANLAYFSLTIALVALQLLPAAVFAQNQNPSRADATPTGFEQVCNQVLVESQGIAGCINKIYLFSLGAGALIALLMLVLAGYRYMTAGGNAEQVQTAKDTFQTTFTGLIIIFVAFILLYVINPDLVQFKKLSLPTIRLP
ncbi:MAG: hypothetical protein A3C85_03765 [Candidatus Doudnabacteria bacterium RIFCSPHIGHO2_02_FULL_48_21]|uniref:DUF4134 domain-containing protein n=1 Tax=Candidatus Doudnabacteria bacterium RIFCSPLOWO2_02_FULL_48_13 TaxID=1817845 RepID=A0A1F5QBW9_9BACT|nr:MAG: hypothetical protein A3K05_03260 [Candidatus Doudnabacteria bacterium RIFCSPHIGHO2_01_48_18]OGE79625.1 MAG: hypothetical protein A2668_01380 [Candidatus Doudnabacteria bacterium RIFCSPHIGHO2_01_FULL_48_180]OGE91760.1 MAG: hypothetical protein A3F44_00105 [Candidatus Doudnabacteria bacterium RIFCSPHIGHO2_12_FULL_47_25]OGE93573.1 MAG: hypothetical protein A3C85_03765 [Candidatus Doudnabacteria bacterium RIFCSPHIGHO2_02_FULL_48_21]OGE96338.1 MAG: hypothetical protein A3A83_00220 [Candidatu